MKRISAWLLTACVVLSMVACGTKQSDPKGNSSTPTVTTTAPTSTPTDVPTKSSTEVPTEVFTKATDAKQTTQTVINVRPPAKSTATKLTKPTTEPSKALGSTATTKPTVLPTEKPTTAPTTVPITAPTTVPITAPTTSAAPLKRKEDKDQIYVPYDEVLNRIGTPETSEVSLGIPVYYELELLLYTYGTMFDLGLDACYHRMVNTFKNYGASIYATYPTNALRIRADNTSYLIYDTDTGYRFYLFVDNDPLFRTVGFPILIKKNNMLSYLDFQDVQINDALSKVEAIDDIMIFSKHRMLSYARDGLPVSSIHYLKDGILKIDYTLSEDKEFFVSNITFNKDYLIKTWDDRMISHKIKDIDLPVS
ncbi:MAG: hypothetical protein IJX01_05910 [Oscillospiraceae bacterium]|nr:hypothetical protein [Oscillospiraceae bacterium]